MKKDYSKPEVLFESFELSQSIAAGCEFITNQAREVCAVDVPGIGMVFTNACVVQPLPGLEDRICYDVPSGNNNVFSS